MEKLEADTVVVGGGPAGYAAAIRLGQLGVDCLIAEKNKLGGTCLNVGCIPSKALLYASSLYKSTFKELPGVGIELGEAKIDWSKTIDWKDDLVGKLVGGIGALLKANKVRSQSGEARLTGANTLRVGDGCEVYFKNLILATGSSVVELPDFPFDGETVLSSAHLLELRRVPKSLTVLGGGIIGMELGFVYASLGVKVRVIEMQNRILPTYETEAVRIVQKSFKSLGGEVVCGAKAISRRVVEGGVELVYEKSGAEHKLESELLAVAVGRKSNFEGLNVDILGLEFNCGRVVVNDRLQSSLPHVYAVGDLIDGPMLAHKATAEGVLAAEAIAGEKVSRADVRVIPDVVYTKPEIASVGVSEDLAKERGISHKVGKFPLRALGRSMTTNEPDGYVKYVADGETGRVIGATIVATRASDLIGESALAVEMGAFLEDLALTVHPHPSFSEGHMEAAAAALNKAIHIVNPTS